MKIIVAPDKFKGSLSSFEVARAISNGIRNADPTINCHEMPMADGGDGFSAVMKHYLATETVSCSTVDPLGRKINAFYEWDVATRTAIIEMAVASGLALLKETERNALRASTFGTGLMIRHAIERGADKVILGVGGSATTDAGIGVLSALGFHFEANNNRNEQLSGGDLLQIKKIVPPQVIPSCKFLVAADVTNLMHGPDGAAYVYAPQKGADPGQVVLLDKGLKKFSALIEEQTGKDVATIPASGAAGGIAAGLLAFFPVEIESGIQIVLKTAGFSEEMKNAAMIITGEGQVDRQTFSGKVVGTIASLATKHNVPCIAICGGSELSTGEVEELGLKKLLLLRDEHVSKEEAIRSAFTLLEKKTAMIPGLFRN